MPINEKRKRENHQRGHKLSTGTLRSKKESFSTDEYLFRG
jgi:protein involved in sex pheromone biosynthesis